MFAYELLLFRNRVAQLSFMVVRHERFFTFLAVKPLHMKSRIIPFPGRRRNLGSTSWALNQNQPSTTYMQ